MGQLLNTKIEQEMYSGILIGKLENLIRLVFWLKCEQEFYRYDPDFVENKELEGFTEKKEILARDKFRCVQCGKGLQDGVRLEVDHIKPKDKGGKATIENGQVLCAPHKLQEKELSSNRNR